MTELKTATNISNLAVLASDIWHEYQTCIMSETQIDYMIKKFQSENAIKNQIKNENYVYFFICENETVCGYTGLKHKENCLFLSKLYLKAEYRHSGVGTKAFELIKKYAADNNYSKIILTVNKYNQNSINAYKKWGFNTVASVVNDIGGGFVMDDYIMQYKLK